MSTAERKFLIDCDAWLRRVSTSTTPPFKSKNRTSLRKRWSHAIVISAPGTHRQQGKQTMSYLPASFLIGVFLLQTPSLDSPSPKERQAAIEEMSVIGNAKAIPT